MAVDRMRCREPFEIIFSEVKRTVADPWSFRRIAQKLEATHVFLLGQEGAQHGNIQVIAFEEIEGIIIAESELAKFNLAAAVPFC